MTEKQAQIVEDMKNGEIVNAILFPLWKEYQEALAQVLRQAVPAARLRGRNTDPYLLMYIAFCVGAEAALMEGAEAALGTEEETIYL